jgi:UDP-N-acetylmuramoylalanine--D-glutamate ligase
VEEKAEGTAILGKEKATMYLCLIWKIKEKYKEVLINNGIAWEEERHTEDLILNADVVMKSPGIPEKCNCKRLIEKGTVISEIEFAALYKSDHD